MSKLLPALLLTLTLIGCTAGTTNPITTTTTTTAPTTIPNLQSYTDATGTLATYTTAGSIDLTNPFFQTIGTNTRTCATCHQLNQAMSLNASTTAALFTSTNGADPLFDAIDGANCPTVATGNAAGHSLITQNGLIRVAVTLPSTAQFTITTLNDPYGCATTLSATGQQIVSVYRRPLPVTSLMFLSDVMWDTRESTAALNSPATCAQNLSTDLTAQMLNAISTHEQGTATPTTAQTSAILTFIQTLFTAQTTDTAAGSLSVNGANAGPTNLASTTYTPGINDPFGGNPTNAAFTPNAFTLFSAWANSNNPAQASIARGENIFNTAPMQLAGVPGLPAALPGQPAPNTCTTCHDTPNVGSHSLPVPMDTGIAHAPTQETDPNIQQGLAQLTAPTLPIYQITGCKVAGVATTFYTTDPGKGLFTGQCADLNRMKIPSLRGLAARAPYFHNGSAPTLAAVVNFYNARFRMNLNPNQKTDLINFLNAL